MWKQTYAVFKNSLREQLRNKLFWVFGAFALVLLYASVLLGVLAVEQEVRVLLDFGLALMEFLALATVLLGAAGLLLQEMENRTIYLILSRPVRREAYLLGRYLGLVGTVFGVMVAMGAAHLVLLLLRGWDFTPLYGLAVFSSFLKMLLMGALAVLVSLVATSLPSTLSIVLILWILGHVWGEVQGLIAKSSSSWVWLLNVFSWITPNLTLLNLRDFWGAPGAFWPLPIFSIGYALFYSGACLAIAALLFRQREF
ncbi:MAG: ABC transporter permease subunit [Elusimicrobia bacterium]|nr:ABC transporter permease subunit [Elusimicrobiota bacterium]